MQKHIWRRSIDGLEDLVSTLGMLDGQPVDIFKIINSDGDTIIVWCDMESHLPLKVKRNGVNAASFSPQYPDSIPHDVYELGVPREATIVELSPAAK